MFDPIKKAITDITRNRLIFCVVGAGIEPATQGFSVPTLMVQYGLIWMLSIDNQHFIFQI